VSRSTYVYIANDEASGPIGAFTVKHEFIHWLQKRTAQELLLLTLYRLRDGSPDRVKLDKEELLRA
jgi:hypothetical protein